MAWTILRISAALLSLAQIISSQDLYTAYVVQHLVPASAPLETITYQSDCPNGKTKDCMKPGDVVELGEGCGRCVCDEDCQPVCSHPPCPVPTCWDFVSPSPYCCPQCPHGNNCITLEGNILAEGGYTEEQGQNCSCVIQQVEVATDPPSAVCELIPTKHSPPTCLLPNGTMKEGINVPGDIWRSEDSCEMCKCKDDGEISCKVKTCPQLKCPDLIKPDGWCCHVCQDEMKICLLGTGLVLRNNETTTFENGTMCSCKEDEDNSMCVVCQGPSLAKQREIAEKKSVIEGHIADLKKRLTRKEDKLSLTQKKSIRRRIKKLKKNLEKLE